MNVSMPLLEALAGYAGGERLGFHMPGHQQGKALLSYFAALLSKYGAALDVTELPGLDNLAAASDSIERSQAALAELTGSRSVYYLVNGATAGLEAAMLAMSSASIPTFMPAHCHTAIYNGLILSGSSPIIMPCLADLQWGLPLGVDQGAAEAYFARESVLPEKALWVSVHPTYHGVPADLAWEKALLQTQPDWGWLVDEAHGAHLPYVNRNEAGSTEIADKQIMSALAYGAHVVVHSIHKMGAGFTQTAVLHNNQPALSTKLNQALRLLQSSSPSYLLLASLDAWQAFLHLDGIEELRRTENLANAAAAEIRALGAYRLWTDEIPAGYRTDPRKITLSSSALGIQGLRLADILRLEYGVDVEMASPDYVLFMINIGHSEADVERLVMALKEIKDKKKAGNKAGNKVFAGDTGKRSYSRGLVSEVFRSGQKPLQPDIRPREAYFMRRKMQRLDQATGCFAAGSVTPYPPGIPVLFPGMEITAALVETIQTLKEEGYTCAGLVQEDERLFIDVLDES